MSKRMYCTQCGFELEDADRFCSQCGHPTRPGYAAATVPVRLTRPMDQKKIAGVCAGLARYLNMDVTLVRILFLAVAICTGIGFIAYLVAWILMPKDPVVPAVNPYQAAQQA